MPNGMEWCVTRGGLEDARREEHPCLLPAVPRPVCDRRAGCHREGADRQPTIIQAAASALPVHIVAKDTARVLARCSEFLPLAGRGEWSATYGMTYRPLRFSRLVTGILPRASAAGGSGLATPPVWRTPCRQCCTRL